MRKQLDHIDLLVEVGSEQGLAIEDNVHTDEHGEQLQAYREAVKKRDGDGAAVFGYLRTGEQSDLPNVEERGCHP